MKFKTIFLLLLFSGLTVIVQCCHDNERTSLLIFKTFLSDPSGRLSSWRGKNCCNWKGVHCSNDTSHVVKVDLRNPKPEKFMRNLYSDVISISSESTAALNGTISPALLNLFHLNYLDLSYNNFDYSKIHNHFSKLTSLVYLNLSNSMFSSPIKNQFANMSTLQYLDISCSSMITDFSSLSFSISTSKLSYKFFTSYLPTSYVSSADISWLRGLSNLKVLNLTGAEPISVLSNLRELSLSDCSISGPFPLNEFHNLSHLSHLRMDSNPLSSPMPIQLANFTSLTVLDLNNCQLQGSVPYLPQLQYLDVSVNNDLMVDLVHMFDHPWTKLQLLSVSFTNVGGTIPSSVSNASSLIHLLASHCSIRGSLPDSISNLRHLQYLDLSHNYLNGSIPFSISKLRNLQGLNLNENGLNGPIPESVCEVSSLESLLITRNNLNESVDSVPSCIFKLRKLLVFDVTGNKLNGTISFRSMFLELNPVWISFDSNSLDVKIDVRYLPTSKFERLEALGLRDCNLKSYIPTFICNMTQLYRLDLSLNNFIGSIPSCIFNLPHLSYLDLSNNKLEGTLPHSIYLTQEYPYSALQLRSNKLRGSLPLPPKNVGIFDLSENEFTGEISDEVGARLSNADHVSLCSNNLSGSIPSAICSPGSSLRVLDISKNKLSGEIPSTLKYCSSLVSLNFGANNLTGTIPNELQKAKNLRFLQLYKNNLNGTFPTFIQQFQYLEVLSLWGNSLEGGIPHFLGSLSNLRIITLSSNMFSGSIPEEITDLHKLQFLDLSNNKLSGSIPEKIGNLEILKVCQIPATEQLGVVYTYNTGIDLSRNFLEGTIPKDICLLKGLKMLNLSHNHLHGMIPMNVGNMVGLESLDLSFNRLAGHIPVSLTSIDPLSTLDLSYNNLSGMIPRGAHFDLVSLDGSAYIGNDFISLPNIGKRNDIPVFYSAFVIGIGTGIWGFVLVLVFVFLLSKKNWWLGYWRFIDSVALRISAYVLNS
ncbi:hypothetical protein MKW92_009560 [Papaver armeniacum]|nr:hypothetical protein MKW92_009560 [Papaver armeniacum]